MFLCIDTKTGKHTEGFQTLDEAQKKLLSLQKEARLKGKICLMTIIEVDEMPDEDEFLIY
jgi:hypothetical protein